MRAPLCSQEVRELLLVEAEVEEVEVTQIFRKFTFKMVHALLLWRAESARTGM